MSYPLPHQEYPPIATGLEVRPVSSIGSGSSPLIRTHVPPLTDGSPRSSASRVRKSRSSKGNDVEKQVHRSISTPQLKGSGSMSDSDQDKKRNKLGYQRISIACAHCRRRKIRCVLTDGDAQQRCQNCIRLRKECVFYPVDQQNVLDGQSQSSSKAGNESVQDSAVSPSPPESGARRPLERSRQFGSFPSVPSNAPPYQLPLEPGSALPIQGDYIPGYRQQGMPDSSAGQGPVTDFRYTPVTDPRQQWAAPEQISPQGQPIPRTDEAIASPTYWRTSSTTMQADFAPFPHASSAVTHATPDTTYAFNQPHPELQSWHTPHSSAAPPMYGNGQENTHTGYQSTHMMYQAHPGHPSAPAAFPPLDMSRAIAHPPVPGPHSAPVGTPVLQYGHPQAFMYPPLAQLADSPLPNQQNFSGPWYQDSSPYTQSPQHGQQRPAEQGRFTSRTP